MLPAYCQRPWFVHKWNVLKSDEATKCCLPYLLSVMLRTDRVCETCRVRRRLLVLRRRALNFSYRDPSFRIHSLTTIWMFAQLMFV
jgi:hypothetical protein